MDEDIGVLPCRVEDTPDFEMSNIVVGSGGYGVIKIVRDARPGVNKSYACKHINKKHSDGQEGSRHDSSKAEDCDLYVLKRVKGGPFLAQLCFYYDCSDYLQLLCDYAHRGDLFEYMKEKRILSNEEVVFIASEVVLALSFLHGKQLVYRDLKTENVLIFKDGHIQLTDFGLTAQLSDENPKTNRFCGTIDYMAPEIVMKLPYAYGENRAEREPGFIPWFSDFEITSYSILKEVDWWALGILICELLTGFPPFHDENQHVTLENILNLEVQIPLYFQPATTNIVVRLTDKSQQERLGANGPQEVMLHWFFKGVNWNDLPNKSIRSPLLPVPRKKPNNLHYGQHCTTMAQR